MWVKSENSEPVAPPEVERSGRTVIVRRRFKAVAATADRSAHYEYDEWQMSAEQYEVYQDSETQIRELSDALVELAEIVTEVL